MAVLTLQQLIEEKDAKKAIVKIVIGGTELPIWTSCTYSFEIGQVPTASITVPGLGNLPSAVQEEAAVDIRFGYKFGSVVIDKLVFGLGVVDAVGNNGSDIVITAVMDGPRKLSYSYNRRIAFDFDAVTANEAVTALLELAGVNSYAVDLDPWLIGTVVPYTAALGNQIQFSSYGDAINKVAEVDGSPWYAMPSGQVRVEKRDAVPSPTARRIYFTSILTGPIETIPRGITNLNARPRINDISKNKNRRDVANFIEVDGAVVVTLGPNGEQNSDQIKETVDGASGQFPNGAYWIPTPPLFQDFNFSNELIDTNAKAFEVCERYFDLKNRLFEELPISVPGDPDVFLGETVDVRDPVYSGTGSLYFVKGYSTTIDQSSCTTSLSLIGGPEAGVTGFAAPFADFVWSFDPLISGGPENPIHLKPHTKPAAKLCEDKPTDSTPTDNTDDPIQSIDTAVVYIGLDGTVSEDFDGFIVSWVWTWTDSNNVNHTLNGPRQTIVVEPSGSVNMTLTVTDNSGRTDSVTKNINTSVNTTNPPTFDPGMNDTPKGGGEGAGPCTEQPVFPNPYGQEDVPGGECNGLEIGFLIAGKSVAMGTVDNRIWHDLTKAAADIIGDFISVDAGVNNEAQTSTGIFGTSEGEIVRTVDNCVTGAKVFTVPGGPRIECIHFDTQVMGSPIGELPPTEDPPVPNSGNIPVYTFASPGTMTIVQAYQQCRAVGFSHTTAIIATAIMVRESGLYSKAMNTAGNTPPSTDRGICQWNDFYHPDISDACAYNTECAITKMFQKSSGGSDFSPWNVHGPGTYLEGTNITAVQQAVGGSGTTITPQNPTTPVSPSGFKIWAGTSDGRIYVSTDSGKTWELWHDFQDGYPILEIGTPPRYGAQSSSLWVFGGDTGNIDTLVRIDPATDKNFVPLYIAGDLRAAIQAAGPGAACRSSMNDTASIIVFNNSVVTERVWTNPDPLGTPDGWTACGVVSGTFNTVAPGNDGDFVIAGSTIEKTSDNETFNDFGAGPSTVHQMIWRGLPGMYAMALADGFYTTIDFGETNGPMRPNATFGTTWPVGAVGYQIAVSYGARSCPPTGSEPTDCTSSDLFYLNYESTGSQPDHFYRLAGGAWTTQSDLALYTQPHWVKFRGDTYYVISPLEGSPEAGSGQGGGHLLVSSDKFVTVNPRAGQIVYTYSLTGSDRIWALIDVGNVPDFDIAYSDDDGVSWTTSKSITGVDNLGHIAAHPSDSNRIAVPWALSPGSILTIEVSIDGGSTWNSFPIGTIDDSGDFYASNAMWAYWLPSGRLVVIYKVEADVDDTLLASYSDDDGISWTTVEITPIENGFFGLLEVVATSDGVLFILVNTGIGEGVWRSGGGATSWEHVDLPSGSAHAFAITFDAITEKLYGLFDDGSDYHIYALADALTGSTWDEVPDVPFTGAGLAANNLLASSICGIGGMFIVKDSDVMGFDGSIVSSLLTNDPNQSVGNHSWALKSFGGKLFWHAENTSGEGIIIRSEDNGITTIPGGSLAPDYISHFDIDAVGNIYAIVSGASDSIYKSVDSGASWSLVLGSLANNTFRGSIACHLTDVNKIAFLELLGGVSATLKVSTNAGVSFGSLGLSAPATGFDHFFGFQPRWLPSGRLVWCFLEDTPGDFKIQWSDDNGASVAGNSILMFFGTFASFDGMWMDSDGVLYVSAIDNSNDTHIFRSPDGSTWTDLGVLGATNSRVQGVAFVDENMYVLNDVPEIWQIANPGTTWSPVSVSATGSTAAGTQDAFVAMVT